MKQGCVVQVGRGFKPVAPRRHSLRRGNGARISAVAGHARNLTARSGLVSLVVFLVCGGVGCGYSTARPFPADIHTIHVEMFHSREFRRELEFRLTEAVVKRIEMDTPYRIAPLDRADAVLTGEILEVQNRTLGNDFDTDLPREIGSTIIVRVRLKDLRSGRIIMDRPRELHQVSYIPPVGETFTQGMTRGLEGLAEQIVEAMETEW